MKVHYINILLFALPLNILAHNKNKPYSKQHTQTNRSLCECDLYIPNYDSDPQMKSVMDNFNKQTQQRFHEYDERMKTTRQKCKERCDKEIQKIVLKDKLEKELMDKFVTLRTDIQNDAIPTCVCEKSIADKVEKGCLRCAQNLGGIVVPSSGVIGEIAALSLSAWKNAATASAIDFATKAGIKAGIAKVIAKIKEIDLLNTHLKSVDWTKFINGINYNTVSGVSVAAKDASASIGKPCVLGSKNIKPHCDAIYNRGQEWFGTAVKEGIAATATKTESVEKAAMGTIESTTTTSTTAIIASVVTIVVIVLILVIIYLILRHRRKKKMKKKLQYIKLLEE
ncbi:rifin PIR protein,putative [Plasmodium sp. DRC-Itaito]|nr:rifin PIR protein,putative [Plasmodium sp. DRC-Itaito]